MTTQNALPPGMSGEEAAQIALSYQKAAAESGQAAMRMGFALKILRAWGGYRGSEGWHGGVVADVLAWIDAGMSGPVPWTRSPFFDEWAAKNGWENVDGFIGFRFTANLDEPV